MADVPYIDPDYDPVFSDYVALLKPRVMSLVVFTAFVGLMSAPVALHPVEAFCSVLFIAMVRGLLGHSICGGMQISMRSCVVLSPGQFRQVAPLMMQLWALVWLCLVCLF